MIRVPVWVSLRQDLVDWRFLLARRTGANAVISRIGTVAGSRTDTGVFGVDGRASVALRNQPSTNGLLFQRENFLHLMW